MTDAADDFDALFDEVSAQRDAAPAAAAVAAEPAQDDFEALFDQVAAQSAPSAAAAATPAAPLAALAPAAPFSEAAEAYAAADGNAADKPMFERLGGIVRLLHDSLRELGYDKALTEASTQINDAQDRLAYVASLTEQAANKVLNTLDDGMPAQDALSKNARQMENRWADLYAGKLSIDEFKALAGDSRDFAKTVTAATDAEKARLLEIMMAQDFQDITGQLIKKVVAITKTVEHELAELLRDNAPPAVREKLAAAKPALMSGPSVPSVALDQDNVDDLLADLGF